MSCDIIVGAQWGDEGKAKIIDFLSDDAKYIVRFQGGANAGHTVIINNDKFVFHLVPSGILHPDKIAVIGSGMVIDPIELLSEIKMLNDRGIKTEGRIKICGTAHILLPYHKILDQLSELKLGNKMIGTTRKGIGPAYAYKIERKGFRFYDLMDDNYKEIIKAQSMEIAEMISALHPDIAGKIKSDYYDGNKIDSDKIIKKCVHFKQTFEQMITNVPLMIDKALKNGENVIAEGAQGAGLDINFGTYPFVTSSNPIAGGACTGIGIGPTKISKVYGILKAYLTRVGEGPFPTELDNDLGEQLRAKGGEFGATTGRPRRTGWLDIPFARYSTAINGITDMIITKLDVLDDLEEINVCTSYKIDGKETKDFTPKTSYLNKVEPVYTTLPGWMEKTNKVKKYDELPENAKKYLAFIEEQIETSISILSVGPDRYETIHL